MFHLRRQYGFSLIELVVTVVVMSILLATAMSLLRYDRGEDVLKQKADAFQYFYQAVADEAMLTGKLVRIVRQEDDKQVQLIPQSKPQRGGEWTTISGDFEVMTLDKPIDIALSATPTLFPSGQSSTFSAIFSLDERDDIVLNVDGMGRITKGEAQ